MKTFLKEVNGVLGALKPAGFVSEFTVAADHVYIRFIQSGTSHCAGTCQGGLIPGPKTVPPSQTEAAGRSRQPSWLRQATPCQGREPGS